MLLVALVAGAQENRFMRGDTTFVEQPPMFRGKDLGTFASWVASRVVFPPEVAAEGVYGRVVVVMFVEADGSVSNVQLEQSPHPLLGEEVVRVVKRSPKWEPGYQRMTLPDGTTKGGAVRTRVMVPVSFRMPDVSRS